MQVIRLKMKDYAYLQLVECEPGIVQELNEYFCFEVPGAKFMPAVRAKRWDGKVRLLNNIVTIYHVQYYRDLLCEFY